MFHCDDLKREDLNSKKIAESVETNLQKRRGKENKAVTANIPIRRWTKPNADRWYVLRVAFLADTLLGNSIL